MVTLPEFREMVAQLLSNHEARLRGPSLAPASDALASCRSLTGGLRAALAATEHLEPSLIPKAGRPLSQGAHGEPLPLALLRHVCENGGGRLGLDILPHEASETIAWLDRHELPTVPNNDRPTLEGPPPEENLG